jgi:hypothetical protein
MFKVVEILFFMSLTATALSLSFGLYAYFKGGDVARPYSNRAMRWRVALQGLTLVLFLLMLSLRS